MPYPKEHLRLSFLFNIAGTDEVADTGLNISTLGGSPFNSVAAQAAATNTQLDGLLPSYKTMVTLSSGSIWADYSVLVGVKLAALDAAGHYLSSPRTRDFVSSNVGAKAGIKAQNTEVLTLWSGLTFGSANYGRMYLPHTALGNNATEPYSYSGDVIALGSKASVWLDSINTLAATWTAGAGIVNLSKVGAGTVKAVATVRVGRVTDTQRRRRNRLTENYVDTAL